MRINAEFALFTWPCSCFVLMDVSEILFILKWYLLFVVSVGNIYSAFSLWQFILYSDLAVETLTPEHINISVSINTSKCER